jgi:hypothetical protein
MLSAAAFCRSCDSICHFDVDRHCTEADGSQYTSDEAYIACSLPPGNSIADSFQRWLHPCGMDGSCSVRIIAFLPSVFVCQINSYEIGHDGNLYKVFKPLELQSRLTLSDREGQKGYELCSVVLHSGIDLKNGHYICIVRAAGRWLLADDAYFRGLGDDEVGQFLATGKVNGYDQITVSLAFYQRA